MAMYYIQLWLYVILCQLISYLCVTCGLLCI